MFPFVRGCDDLPSVDWALRWGERVVQPAFRQSAYYVWMFKEAIYEGHQGKVTIVNKDAVALSDWVLEFDYNGEVKSISNAVLVSHVGNHYVVKAPKTMQTLTTST